MKKTIQPTRSRVNPHHYKPRAYSLTARAQMNLVCEPETPAEPATLFAAGVPNELAQRLVASIELAMSSPEAYNRFLTILA